MKWLCRGHVAVKSPGTRPCSHCTGYAPAEQTQTPGAFTA